MVTLAQAKQRILNKWDWIDSTDNKPVILWGPVGCGKTSLVYSLVAERMTQEIKQALNKSVISAEEKTDLEHQLAVLQSDDPTHEFLELISNHCIVIRLAERPIEQLQGVVVPSLSEENNFVKFVMPENLVKIKDIPWGIVFLDELDKASDSKFGAATHILENRVIGDLQLPKGWYVIAAANREEDTHLANHIPPELRNRCANIEVDPDLQTWIDWANKHNVRSDIVLFHKFNNGEWLNKYDLEQTFSFPTARSWTAASRVIDKLEKRMKVDYNNPESVKAFDEVVRNELMDFVGKQAQSNFFQYRELYLKFNVKEILEGTKRVTTKNNSTKYQIVISDQCVATFAMADQIKEDWFITEKASASNNFKAQYNEIYIKNLVQFIQDLIPEIRVIYVRQIYNKKIMNIILNSGLAEKEIDEICKLIAT